MVAYASNESGDLELKMVYFTGPGDNPDPFEGDYFGPVDISHLNSSADDAYLCFFGPGYIRYEYGMEPSRISEIYFCSDRGENFDIYKEDVPAGIDLVEFLGSDTSYTIIPVPELNSEYQDKCPYIDGDLMVFTSDRPGGYGGFDLYFSQRNGSTWTEPVNFGKHINTEYNEYRPIVLLFYEFEQDMMMFSSDRPGGKGGYDLYYVGISKMIE